MSAFGEYLFVRGLVSRGCGVLLASAVLGWGAWLGRAADGIAAPLRGRGVPIPPVRPPGVVIDHSPQSSGRYIGSPSLTVLPDGAYLASHDFFGPASDEHVAATTVVFRSEDGGLTWGEVARVRPLFWANLFTHRGAAYLMGTEKHHGRIVIRRSTDGGRSWTEPRDSSTGVLTVEGQYHTAPVPVVEHRGRLWRGFEDAMGGTEWGKRYQAHVLSAPAEADLLLAANWTLSAPVGRDARWLGGTFNGWLEGNAVVARDGRLVNVLRVDTPGWPEKAAIIDVGEDGREMRFDPALGFIDFPGGAKKFTIRFDRVSDRYWSLATWALTNWAGTGKPAGVRNTLALTSSPDLRRWEVRCVLLHHPDVARHGFQYPDWHFEGEDMIAVVRTAFDDVEGGARNNHDANYLTFHRIRGFRRLGMADSVSWPGNGRSDGVGGTGDSVPRVPARMQGGRRPEAPSPSVPVPRNPVE